MPSVGPVPPPPPIEDLEDCQSEISYGNGVDTYTNNYMADDESVEAQHVVYTFAEEKSSKAGRKKWTILMCSILFLLATIIALGAVYGIQRRNRNQLVAEANAAKTGPKGPKEQTTAAPVDTNEVLDDTNEVLDDTNEVLDDTNEVLGEDVYITPTNSTTDDADSATTQDATEPEDEFPETLEPTTWVTSRWGARIFPSEESTFAPTESTTWSGTRRPLWIRFPNRPRPPPPGWNRPPPPAWNNWAF